MLSMTIKDDDKTIYAAEGDAIMDVLLAFSMYSHDEDFDRTIRRAAYLLNPPKYPPESAMEDMKDVGSI